MIEVVEMVGGGYVLGGAIVAGTMVGLWAVRHPARVREWRRTAKACGLTDVRVVRALAVPRRLEAQAGWLTVSFRSRPRQKDDPTRGTIVVGGLASGLHAPAERSAWFGASDAGRTAWRRDVPPALAGPPVGGPPLLLCALLDARARRLVAALFQGYVEGEDGSQQGFPCRARIAERELTIDYYGALSEQTVRGVIRAAECLVSTEDPAADAAANFHAEQDASTRAHILRTLVAAAPGHAATAAAVRAGLADASEAVRLEAALAEGPDGRSVLREVAASDAAPEGVVARAITALSDELPSEEIRTRLAAAIARRQVRAAIACAEVLGARGPAETPPLVAALRSVDPGIVIAAAQALGRHGESREAVIALREAQERNRADADLAAAVREAVPAVQLRIERAAAGQLSVAGPEAGTLALSDDGRGRVALDRAEDPPQS
jgi:hypothetical protein